MATESTHKDSLEERRVFRGKFFRGAHQRHTWGRFFIFKKPNTTKIHIKLSQFLQTSKVVLYNFHTAWLTLQAVLGLGVDRRRVQGPVQVTSEGLLVLSMDEFNNILMHHIGLLHWWKLDMCQYSIIQYIIEYFGSNFFISFKDTDCKSTVYVRLNLEMSYLVKA